MPRILGFIFLFSTSFFFLSSAYSYETDYAEIESSVNSQDPESEHDHEGSFDELNSLWAIDILACSPVPACISVRGLSASRPGGTGWVFACTVLMAAAKTGRRSSWWSARAGRSRPVEAIGRSRSAASRSVRSGRDCRSHRTG